MTFEDYEECKAFERRMMVKIARAINLPSMFPQIWAHRADCLMTAIGDLKQERHRKWGSSGMQYIEKVIDQGFSRDLHLLESIPDDLVKQYEGYTRDRLRAELASL